MGGGQEMEAMVEKDTELHVEEHGIVYCLYFCNRAGKRFPLLVEWGVINQRTNGPVNAHLTISQV